MASSSLTLKPILKLSSSYSTPSTNLAALSSLSTATTGTSTPRVHFPPTPILASTFSTYSTYMYDRSSIIVRQNPCDIPERGYRTYYTGGSGDEATSRGTTKQRRGVDRKSVMKFRKRVGCFTPSDSPSFSESDSDSDSASRSASSSPGLLTPELAPYPDVINIDSYGHSKIQHECDVPSLESVPTLELPPAYLSASMISSDVGRDMHMQGYDDGRRGRGLDLDVGECSGVNERERAKRGRRLQARSQLGLQSQSELELEHDGRTLLRPRRSQSRPKHGFGYDSDNDVSLDSRCGAVLVEGGCLGGF